MANPRVRPHLRFYPEDAGKLVSEYYQAAHWRQMDDNNPYKFTPMAVVGTLHYYIYEPCVLCDGRVCVPYEWFYRNNQLKGNAWMMHPMNGRDGWIVEEYNKVEISSGDLLVNFSNWDSTVITQSLPKATNIHGIFLLSTLFI